MPEVYDQENLPENGEGNRDTNHGEAFKEFVKPGVGEVEPPTKSNGDDAEIAKSRATLIVDTPPNSVTPPENILADQYHQETIENNKARDSRPEKKSHLGAKILVGLTSLAASLGLIHVAADRQEEVDRRKAEDQAPIAKAINDRVIENEMQKEAKAHGIIGEDGSTTQYASGNEKFEVKTPKE